MKHFWTVDVNGEMAPLFGHELDGPRFYTPLTAAGTSPMYRWFHAGGDRHFWTTDPNGESAQLGFTLEHAAYRVFTTQQSGTVPLYRWYHPNSQHFYTTDPNGEGVSQFGYTLEGPRAFVYPDQRAGSIPVYRWYQSGFMANWTFDAGITAAQRLVVLQRHAYAYHRAQLDTGNLSAQERDDLLFAYRNKTVSHGIDPEPRNNASTHLGSSRLLVNFANFMGLTDDDRAMTLIHEMMHMASRLDADPQRLYDHPRRRDFDPANPTAPIDTPGDGGLYYGTAPLRAEFCIAGWQSDAGRATLQRMVVHDQALSRRTATE